MKNSPEEKILISVVTPVYNGESFVQSAYDCLCRQTYQNWEWVLVNDGSTDSTSQRLKELTEKDSRIRFFQQSMMDEVTFREQISVVNKRINELRVRRQKLLHEDEDEECIELFRETREQLAEMPDAILWFEPDIFKKLIAKVYVLSKDSLAFELKCGLKFKEKIVWD